MIETDEAAHQHGSEQSHVAQATGDIPTPRRSLVDALLLAITLGALVGLTVVLIKHYPTSADAATILGIVVPAFATIGAAIFGVTVAYNAGQAKGEAKGEQGKIEATDEARRHTAATLLPRVNSALSAVSTMREAIQSAGASPSRERSLLFQPLTTLSLMERGGDVPVTLDPQALEDAQGELEALRGACEALSGTT
jgi:hypothetical protein